ncbi:MAG: homoserine kinase, partial [Eggerthellaceae bacterium]|nr:homoserine kinase [Eggerthellaceae bacterium]
HMSTDIPVSRGLGSSSACVVAGVMAAVHLSNTMVTKQEIVDIATHIEGHPDNVAPAILGNVTCSFAEDVPSHSNELAHNITIQSTVHPSFYFVAFIPPYEVSTTLARTAVPQEIPLQNAIWNMGRMHALIHALEQGDASLLKASCIDTIHEPYRKKLIPDYHDIASLCANFDTTLWISGSGSTCMAAVSSKTVAQQLIQAAQDAFPNMTLHMLQADTRGAFVTNI